MDILERLGLEEGFLQTRLFSIGDTSITLEKIFVFAIILVLTLIVSRLLQRAVVHALRIRGVTNEGTVVVTKRLLHYALIAIGVGIAIESAGINLAALFAAGAVFAIGLGFALQNITQNFVSGVILLAERSIKPGDVLQVDGRFVKVQTMNIRATIARTLDDEEIIVPNSSIVQSTVTNYTLQDSLYRLRTTVGVVYGSDMRQVREVLERTARRLDWRVPQKEPAVLLTDFGDNSVNWEVSVWIDNPWSMRAARSQLNEAVWWALQEAGIVIAFPQLDVHFDPEVTQGLQRRAGAQHDDAGFSD